MTHVGGRSDLRRLHKRVGRLEISQFFISELILDFAGFISLTTNTQTDRLNKTDRQTQETRQTDTSN